MKVHTALLACALCAAGPALADSTAQKSAALGGEVVKVCRFSDATVTGSQNATFSATSQGGSITLTALADPNTARALPSSISVTFDSVCNQNLVLKLVSENGGLKPAKPGQTGNGAFLNRVDYTATLNWGAVKTTLSTDGTENGSANVSLAGAQSGGVTLNIEIPAGTKPLTSGIYSDVLTVQFDSNM